MVGRRHSRTDHRGWRIRRAHACLPCHACATCFCRKRLGGLPVATAGLSQIRAISQRSPIAADACQAWLRAYALLWTFTLGTYVLVLLMPGGPALARRLLPLALTASHNPPPSLAGVLSIATNNTLRSVWPLALGLVEAQRRPITRLLADGTVLANLLVSGLLVGCAIGGYGLRILASCHMCL